MALYNGHNEDASGNILLSIGNGMTATVESGTTASQAYTKGSYLYYNNRLCKVIAAIASGNTLTVGTNIAYTSLGAELTSHLRSINGNEFYFDYQNGKYGYNTSASRGASTFYPFKNTSDVVALLPSQLTVYAYAGSGSQHEGSVNGVSNMSLISPGTGTIALQIVTTESPGHVRGAASCNGISVVLDGWGDTKTLNVYEGQEIGFEVTIDELNMWQHNTAILRWTWNIT